MRLLLALTFLLVSSPSTAFLRGQMEEEDPTSLSSLSGISLQAPNVAVTVENEQILFQGCNGFKILKGDLSPLYDVVTIMVSSGNITVDNTGEIVLATETSGNIISFSGTTTAVNSALETLKYSNAIPGRYSLSISISGNHSISSSLFVAVNKPIDVITAKATITEGVSEIHSGFQPGRMVAFESTARNIIMYPGKAEREGPLVVAATLGGGRIIAVPDHEILDMKSYGSYSGVFYKNSLKWLSQGSIDPLSIRVITYDTSIAEWLSSEGYTSVTLIDEAGLLGALADAEVFVGWLGDQESAANIEGLKDFVARGGGLFICDYGEGYRTIWDVDRSHAPSNRLLREAGIAFASGSRSDSDTVDARNVASGVQITRSDVLKMLSDPTLFPPSDMTETLYVMNGVYDALASEDWIVCAMDEKLLPLVESINPTTQNPIENEFEKFLLKRESDAIRSTSPKEVQKHRLADATYGTIPDNTPRVTVTTMVDGDRGRWHPTGAYVVPGEVSVVTVPESLVGKGIVHVNANTDDISGQSKWERFPYVHRSFDINSTTLEVANAFGGAVFIDLLGGQQTESPNLGLLEVTISNVVEHPYFDLSKHSDLEWIETLRQKPAPYAVFVAPDIMFSQRATESINLMEPTKLMQFWQKVIELQDYLVGIKGNEDEGIAPRTSNEFINLDIQSNGGTAHIGYPIQTEDRLWDNLADVSKLVKEGSWGDFHVIGHNLQAPWWTFEGDRDVSSDILAAYCLDQLVGEDRGGWGWTIDPIAVFEMNIFSKDTIANKSDNTSNTSATTTSTLYAQRDSLAERLAMWMQLVHSFGWESLHAYYLDLAEDNADRPDRLPKTDQEKKDQLLVRFSNIVRRDLRYFLVDHWGLEVSDRMKNMLGNLKYRSWVPIMGRKSEVIVSGEEPTTLDLKEHVLTLDGYVEIDTSNHGAKHGTLVQNVDSNDTSYTYTPSADFPGADTFHFNVTSTSGERSTAMITVRVAIIVDVEFAEDSPYNGRWTKHPNEIVQSEAIWTRDEGGYMVYFCSGRWVLTNNWYETSTVDGNGGGCGGLQTSDDTSSGEWFQWNWGDSFRFDIPSH